MWGGERECQNPRKIRFILDVTHTLLSSTYYFFFVQKTFIRRSFLYYCPPFCLSLPLPLPQVHGYYLEARKPNILPPLIFPLLHRKSNPQSILKHHLNKPNHSSYFPGFLTLRPLFVVTISFSSGRKGSSLLVGFTSFSSSL